MKILNELTLARPRMDSQRALARRSGLFKYPIMHVGAGLLVDGRWSQRPAGVLSKGGFIMFDGFRGRDWDNLQDQMRLVFPVGQWVELDGSHPIFHSFFEINDPHTMTPPYGGMPPVFYAMFENNDRNGRVMAAART